MLFAALSFVVLIGWIDYVTGWELSLFIIYSLPIALVTWKMGWRFGFAVAFLCTVVYWLAQIESDPHQTSMGFALEVADRLCYFSILVVAVAMVRSRQQLDRSRIEMLERAQVLERGILQASE
ncbi:MAG: hypothetical protein ACLQHK_01805 [Gallionellaceae bacterium]